MSSDIQITVRVILMGTTQDISELMSKFMILAIRVARGARVQETKFTILVT